MKTITIAKINAMTKICPICKKEDDLVGHTLMRCDYAREHWFVLNWGLISDSFCHEEVIEWWKNTYKHGHPSPPLGNVR